jgi:hypothetical protein
MNKVLTFVAEARKALISAAAVLTAITAVNGVPANWQQYAGTALAVLAAGGITYQVPNKPAV